MKNIFFMCTMIVFAAETGCASGAKKNQEQIVPAAALEASADSYAQTPAVDEAQEAEPVKKKKGSKKKKGKKKKKQRQS